MERRREPRVETEGQIGVRILTSGKLETGFLVDLNNVGAFVATNLVLEKGEKVHVELEIPGIEEPTPLQAIVARCSGAIQGRNKTIPAGLGLVFVGNTQEERQLIQQVVMSTLMLDLLSFGCKHQRLKEAAKTHPRGVKVSKAVLAPDDAGLGRP
jgi:Tfp pilus assembly protein PilZ